MIYRGMCELFSRGRDRGGGRRHPVGQLGVALVVRRRGRGRARVLLGRLTRRRRRASRRCRANRPNPSHIASTETRCRRRSSLTPARCMNPVNRTKLQLRDDIQLPNSVVPYHNNRTKSTLSSYYKFVLVFVFKCPHENKRVWCSATV